jgi:hypothetical protein
MGVCRARDFFETGTEMGHGVVAALAAGCHRIFSVDINKQDQDFLTNRVLYDIPEVKLFSGDSAVWLAEMGFLYPAELDNGLVWLDAHATHETPILRELSVIAARPTFWGVLLIDDMRLFRAGNEWAKEVREPNVLAALDKLPGKWERTYEPDSWDSRDILATWRIE